MVTSDQRIQSMCFGKDSIRWGIQISYPALFYNPQTQKAQEMLKETEFGNTKLFLQLRRALRKISAPIKLQFQKNKPLSTTLRMGRQCSPWIQNHPDLQHHQLQVEML